MPESDTTRKRSRSPSDSENQKHHKRANTGATSTSDESPALASSAPALAASAVLNDVTMTEPSATVIDDTAASTPSNNTDQPKADPEHKAVVGDAMPASVSDSTAPSSSTVPPPPPSAHIHMRCLIVTQDASIIIGKGGSHVNEIREKSGAKVMVSESIPGNPERILNVSGPLDAVSKVCAAGMIGNHHSVLTVLYLRPLDSSSVGSMMNLLTCRLCQAAVRLP